MRNTIEHDGDQDGSGDPRGWQHQLHELLTSLNVDSGFTIDAAVGTPSSQEIAGSTAETGHDWGRDIGALCQTDWGVPIAYVTGHNDQHEGEPDDDGEEGTRRLTVTVVGYALPRKDLEPTGIVALFYNGAHYVLSEPNDDAEKQQFRADFMPGAGPFVLELERPTDDPCRLFLGQAVYDVASLLRYDHPKHGKKATDALKEALANAPALAEQRLKTTELNLGEAALAMEQIFPPDSATEQE